MDITLRIARKEFTGFFSSPVAFIFFGAFLAVSLFVFFWVESFFARNIADVRPLNAEEAAIAQAGPPTLEIKVALSEGEPLLYRFWEPQQKNHFLLRRSDRQQAFKVGKYLVDDLSGATRDGLVVKRHESSARSPDETHKQSAPVDAG